MACFLAPVAEAIVVSVIKKNVQNKELAALTADAAESVVAEESSSIPTSRKLGWLSKMLWGGSFLLAIEHIWHGEVIPWPPFLTAMYNAADVQPMLMEIITVGGAMMAVITAAWLLMVAAANHIEKRAARLASEQEG
ncbi:MAG: hypothetical protein Q4B96_04320 [Bacillota bacterium]|nr:hypothetical protein [Bacillota bacterium]